MHDSCFCEEKKNRTEHAFVIPYFDKSLVMRGGWSSNQMAPTHELDAYLFTSAAIEQFFSKIHDSLDCCLHVINILKTLSTMRN